MAMVYTLDDLPPAYEVAQAIENFFVSTKSFYYVTTKATASELFTCCYSGPASQRNETILAELCALAAAGLCYLNEPVSQTVSSERLIATCKIHLDRCIETDILRSLRITSLCTVYYAMQKGMAAVTYAISGLQIARLILAQHESGDFILSAADWEDFHRNFQTLTFLYTLLAGTMADVRLATSNLSTAYIEFAQLHPLPNTISELNETIDLEDMCQRELAKISIITTQMVNECYKDTPIEAEVVNKFLDKIQDWFTKLPPAMQLGSLLDHKSPKILRPFFMAHLIHLSSIILLTRKIFVDVAFEKLRVDEQYETNQDRYFRGPSEAAFKYSSECLLAAQHISRILAILISEKMVFKRCWALIHTTYLACQFLLFSAATKKYASPEQKVDLDALASCLSVLSFCSTMDPVAARYQKSIGDLFSRLNEPSTNTSTTSGFNNGDSEDLPSNRIAVEPTNSLTIDILKMINHSVGSKQFDHFDGTGAPNITDSDIGQSHNIMLPRPIRRPDNISLPSITEAIPSVILNDAPVNSQISSQTLPEESFDPNPEALYEFFQRSF